MMKLKRFSDDLVFKSKWYFKNRFKINRSGRAKEASKEFESYISTLPNNSMVIDVGANLGKYTSLFLSRNFKVHAFEPDPIAVKELRKLCGKDHDNFKLFQKAVGIKKEIKKLYRYRKFEETNPETTIGSSILSSRSGKGKPSIEIECIDFIEYLKKINGKVCLLKIDIEGAEIEILNKIIDHKLHENIGRIYAETHERFSHKIAIQTVKLRLRIVKENIKNINLDWG